ncbi:metal-dependent hydrolase [Marinobacter sp. CA1]|uniref:metal-dependent hydrolase n=1 Tax=Marinobacter sp. CA1 TaxID=2817656 RepID=UPI001D06B739|nr:metal-dependent hydrolase [Marinobacter sp. CA1]UDL04965.1 hypothetical protein J2887_20265 [Marinobacter sp. CA1]
MLTAHLPSGYLLGTQATRWPWARNLRPGLRLGSAMAGAMAPDLDMLYFWLVDSGRVHHHTYLTHYPALWFSLLLPILLLRRFGYTGPVVTAGFLFVCGGCLHLLLDSVVGDIWWLAPFVDQPVALFTVDARYSPWWLNFVLHWSFGLELALWVGAALVWRQSALAGGDVRCNSRKNSVL